MLSLDLFNSRYEKKLHEGAVDDTIAHLIEPLSRRAMDIRTKLRTGQLDPKQVVQLEKEYEELVQKRLDIILDRKTQTQEQQVPSKQDPFAYVKPETKSIGDIQDPKAKMAQLAQRAKKGPLANVGAGIKAFIKGEPEPMDEEQELGRRGIGVRNMKALEATIRQGLAKTVFQFPKVRPVAADEEDSDKLADYYNGLNSAGRSNFVYNVLNDPIKFSQLCKTLGIQLIPVGAVQPDLPGIPSQGEFPLEERKNQKKKFKSTVAQREIEKAMAAEPAAGDPIEAFVLKSLKTDSEQDQQIQDLENKLQNVVTKTVATEPAVMPKIQPSATVAPAPTPAKPAPTSTPTATQAPVELPTPTPTVEPAPTAAELPKKDQKILARVKSIEKRLKDRVDAYQDARAQQDKATLQQQIDALQAQARQQASKLSPNGRLVLGQDDVYDIEANLIREPELEPIQLKKAAESKIKEHGGGIGPRQHWQDLMQEGQPQELINRYLAIDAENDVDAVRAAIQAISRDPALSVTSKSRLLGQIGMIIKRHRLPIGRAYYQFMRQYMEDINETALNPKDLKGDYEAKRRALYDLSLNKDVDQAAVLQRRLDLDREAKAKGLAETVTNVKAGMAEIYRRLAPKIERHRDSFLAGQLYDELENYAELHGAEREFKQMMNGARNRAHMEYDTNPGGFQNWFWFLPFEDENVAEGFEYASKVQHPKYGPGQVVKVYPNGMITVNFPNYPDPIDKKPGIQGNFMPGDSDYKSLKSGMAESTDDIKKRMSKLEALALAANRAGDDAKCKMYQQKIQSLKQKLSQSMNEFDASGYGRYSIYMDDYDLEEKFSDLDDAVEAIEAYKRDDPKSRYADYNVRDLNGKVVWRNDAWQDVQKPGKIQFLPRNDQGVAESSKPGEYYVHTVYFKDGTKKRVRVTSDEFDVVGYYTKRGKAVDHVDYDFQIHSDMTEDLVEGIKDTASATAVIACLLTGGSLSGCATAPQQTSAQQVLKTGQDIGRTVQTAKKITRAGTEAEVQQELRNILRGINRPEELNNSNILRIWKRIKGQPPVAPEPQAPEYGPADPVRRPATEAKEIVSKEDFLKERDRLLRMIGQETNPANKQILKSAIRQLENRAEQEGWITIQTRMVREDSDNGEAVEMAIMRRMLVAHTDLIVEFGLDKVVQAIEEVAYNVGDTDEIGSSDVSGWVHQVKQILGVDA